MRKKKRRRLKREILQKKLKKMRERKHYKLNFTRLNPEQKKKIEEILLWREIPFVRLFCTEFFKGGAIRLYLTYNRS